MGTTIASDTDEDVPAIRLVDMRVDYGSFTAVHGLTLDIPKGEVYGLVGPNGAGKTSTFLVLATLMEPTYGDVYISGVDIAERPEKARSVFAYMPDLAPVPSDIKVWEFLDMFAAAYGVRRKFRRTRVSEVLAEVDLEEKRNDFCKSLSRGMKQRLVLAKSLLHRPQVLVLDEPASGMDPVSRNALRRTLRNLADGGATIIISSHILTELTDICSSVGILSQGRLIDTGKIDDVIERLGTTERSLKIVFQQNAETAKPILEGNSFATNIRWDDQRCTADFSGSDENQAALLTQLVSAGCHIRSFEDKKANIEEVFLNIKQQEDNAA